MTKEEEQKMMEEMQASQDAMSDALKNYLENGIPEEMLQDIANSMNDEYFVDEDIDDIEDDDIEDDDMGMFGSRWSDWSPDPNDYI